MEEECGGPVGPFEDLEVIRLDAGMPTARFVDLIGVPERSWRRWQAKAKHDRPPKGPWPQPTREMVRETVLRLLRDEGLILPAQYQRERRQLARDLHDEMGSALSSINTLSKVAMVEEDSVSRKYLQNIGDQSEKMMENMGDMVWSINPRNDSIEKIIARMREFATEILDAKDIEYLFKEELPPNLAIGSDKRKNLFMIFKEAVNNAAKYSHATRMEIGLVADNGSLVLTVKDNGKGFEEQEDFSGNGLRNMRERAGESGGSLSIRSAPGKGTEIQLRMSIA